MDQHASAGLQEVADLQYLRRGTNMSAAVQVLCTILVWEKETKKNLRIFSSVYPGLYIITNGQHMLGSCSDVQRKGMLGSECVRSTGSISVSHEDEDRKVTLKT